MDGGGAVSSGTTPDVGNLSLPDIMGRLQGIQKAKEKAIQPVEDKLQATLAADQSTLDKKLKELTDKQDATTEPPKPPQIDPMRGFASNASIFGLIAAAFTRTPAIAAMTAMAGAVRAAKDGDVQTYDMLRDQWKQQTDLAIEKNRLMSDELSAIMQKMRTDVSAGNAQLQSYAAKYQDQTAMLMAEAGLGFRMEEIQTARNNAALAMQRYMGEIDQHEKDRQERQREFDANKFSWQPGMGQGPDGKMVAGAWRMPSRGDGAPEFHPGVVAGSGKDWETLADPGRKDATGNPTTYRYNRASGVAFTMDGQPYTPTGAEKISSGIASSATITDADSERLASQVIAGDKSALTGLGYGNAGAANRAKVQSAITAKLKGMGLTGEDLAARTAEYSGLVAGERATGTRAANLGMAANEASGFAPLVIQRSDAVDRSQFPTLNAMQNALDKGTGGEDIVRFIDSVNAFKNAYAQVVTRGGQSTDDARKRADEVISAAWSKGQVKAGIDQLMQEIDIAKGAPNATREELQKAFSHVQAGSQEHSSAMPPLPTGPGGKIDASKLKNGEFYTLPDGRVGQWDAASQHFRIAGGDNG